MHSGGDRGGNQAVIKRHSGGVLREQHARIGRALEAFLRNLGDLGVARACIQDELDER